MMIGVCFAGVLTAHMLMPQVLENRPERVATDVDGYVALVECRHVGKRFTLLMAGRRFRVAVADCVTSKPVGQWPQKNGMAWLGDVASLPGIGYVNRPTPALLCPTL